MLIPLHSLVVSCQALEDEPLYGSAIMAAMARAAYMAGAGGIRAGGAADIAAIKRAVPLPVIGLVKITHPGYDVYITPTLEDALAIRRAGADIVAIDATDRKRPDGRTLGEVISALNKEGIPVMADISTYEEGVRAAALGADYISTTLCGYTEATSSRMLPDLELLGRLSVDLELPVVAEGGIKHPEQAAEALRRGASFVVVGGAITRPQQIAADYVRAINGAGK
ncbi:N-acetylmannosamine-6-phosphate 2-epimerase [Paenibacillus sp. S150]|uniref:N-acetylmannosamine-6-phosphate 2-epimerase n=1 Tax=Paenibacillus sp. S150 TaxID=2749826 RepID=UPI001C56CCCB|nr:putative N-acetylmannosamine-6-phosphate 2-epimerase [Paenibacillus sp. S150]MBW4080980.1 putative N-acetylmannosamine-6-phosphate 2-epimerase [Paenibacillus sp. S150]